MRSPALTPNAAKDLLPRFLAFLPLRSSPSKTDGPRFLTHPKASFPAFIHSPLAFSLSQTHPYPENSRKIGDPFSTRILILGFSTRVVSIKLV